MFYSRLVGPTASGKSSVGFPCYFRLSTVILTLSLKFVEKAAGIEGLSRGSLRSSGTEEICIFKFPFPGVVNSSICLVDTPGIDDQERDFYDIFDMIDVWLNKTHVQLFSFSLDPVIDIPLTDISYRKESSLAGILYFHSISNIQMFTSPSKKLNYLKRLCQNKLNRVVFTTTMWDDVGEGTSLLQEDELKSNCKPLIDEGLSVKRFLNNPSSAFDILRPIVQAALSRQSTIGRALLRVVARSLATKQDSPPPIIVYEQSNSSSFPDAYSGNRIVGPYAGEV